MFCTNSNKYQSEFKPGHSISPSECVFSYRICKSLEEKTIYYFVFLYFVTFQKFLNDFGRRIYYRNVDLMVLKTISFIGSRAISLYLPVGAGVQQELVLEPLLIGA